MSPRLIFQSQLVLGYVAWLLCFRVYVLPWLKTKRRFEAHRAMATLHSFRWVGLVFILPGVVGPNVPSTFAVYGAYGDLLTGLLAIPGAHRDTCAPRLLGPRCSVQRCRHRGSSRRLLSCN